MDPSLYKDISIDKVRYHYYHHPAADSGSYTLLFLHGFPSTSEHWVNQVVYFVNKGYGVIAPDMLGFGGTSRAVDTKLYEGTALAAHCISILDAEGIDKVVVVSHDWGSAVGSKLANLYPERHLASIFISVSYVPPNPDTTVEERINSAKQTLGHDIYSYWKFLASEEAPGTIAKHEESFYSLIYTSDTEFWKKYLSPEGQLEKWLLKDRRAPVGEWAPDKVKHNELFGTNGWYAPTNWYRSIVKGHLTKGDKDIPKERYKITHPVLQVTSLRDPICRPDIAKFVTTTLCTNATIRDLDTGHWPMFEKPGELNAVLGEFLASL